jgi:hypothetical protein
MWRSSRRENFIDRATQNKVNHRYFMGGGGKVTAIRKISQMMIRSDHIHYAPIGPKSEKSWSIGITANRLEMAHDQSDSLPFLIWLHF